MKIALLLPNNLFATPYIGYFTKVLNQVGLDYSIYTWNRHNITEEGTIAYKTFFLSQNSFLKLFSYWLFSQFIRKKLRSGNYEKVIVFTGQLGIFNSSFLKKYFYNNYILDIRDYSIIYKQFPDQLQTLLKNAHSVTISAKGFTDWLPNSQKFVLSHNVDIDLVEESLADGYLEKEFFISGIRVITTIGQIKDYDSDSKVLMHLNDSSNYSLKFIGFGPALSDLKSFIEKHRLKNAIFEGSYKKEEEKDLLKDTDYLNILISRNDRNMGTTLLSNRLYLSALYKIPCIVNAKTAQSAIIEKYKLGIVVEKYSDLPRLIVEFEANFDKNKFIESCNLFLRDIVDDHKNFVQNIYNFINN